MSKAAAFRRHSLRAVLAACLVTTALSPAQAHDRDQPRAADESKAGELAHQLSDRGNQMRAAATLSALSGAVLAMDVSPLTRGLRRMGESLGDDGLARDLPPDATIGDLAGPHAQQLPYELARKTPEMMGKAAGMVSALDEMRPQLKAMARKFKHQLRDSGLGGY
jgi:hypothetical protein